MPPVRGPFIEYECSKCKRVIQENAPRDSDRCIDRIAELNADADYRVCAACSDF
jgi:hypothetical protein